MTHHTARLIAALATTTAATTALAAAHEHAWTLAVAYTALTLLLAALTRHEHHSVADGREAAGRARRAIRAGLHPVDRRLDACCELSLITHEQVHTPGCPRERKPPRWAR
ncbi:hypothetical protein AB0K09_15685 [Streptomyces sp. NPDC049577]|uniref:hypothetical protein n=1 Tax=Streptomyces sp. NPDC049577 TaxID=3155153 RepID=UPI0034438279